MYILVYAPGMGVTGFGIFMVGLGILADLASYAGGLRSADYR